MNANWLEGISVDWLFDFFFKGFLDKPHEHKEECLAATVAKVNEHLDNIIENLKGWK